MQRTLVKYCVAVQQSRGKFEAAAACHPATRQDIASMLNDPVVRGNFWESCGSAASLVGSLRNRHVLRLKIVYPPFVYSFRKPMNSRR